MSYENIFRKENPLAQSHEGPALSPTAPSGLLTLPPEVRLQIYDIYFAGLSYNGDTRIPQRFRDRTARTESSLVRALVDRLEVKSDEFDSRRETSNLNLLFVSKLIHTEAIPKFYHHHYFLLPTYCSPVPSSGWTGLKFEPPVLRSEQMRHFDLIRKLELVHQHLGDVVADRQQTDRAIGALLRILIEKCTSLRYLWIRVISDIQTECHDFWDRRRARNGDYPYLDFRRQTPQAMRALVPRLDTLVIRLVDSEKCDGRGLHARHGGVLTWVWGWKPIAETKDGTMTRYEFFSDRCAEISPEVMKLALAQDPSYFHASLEPFAHFIKPGMDRGMSGEFVRRQPLSIRMYACH